ncbi:DNA helicase HerA, contains HAS-barrel and ATPase domains [Actinomadura madurae]|uniref:DNA helicase HerA, contains HAS-barrel and ATPase domains n=1 Tax=Actinomadura madurae TaxID=1993 RepID=A0A1I5EVK2_9ACTN|nr:ATP-binding protein [Actinomadura madurae]SFO15534.1 DNA helicase HerA, contains HAS-barrel and ATPase domains [Actinomadura madurae]
MSTGLHELREQDLETALERVLAPRLSRYLLERGPGHCMRVTDVGPSLAARLCRRVRGATGEDGQVYVLGSAVPSDVAVTSTKLVELRNPDAHGRQRPPLLVFVTPRTHASAEDSFGVATFEDVPLGDVYAELAARLHAELPETLRYLVEEVFEVVEEQAWAYAEDYARCRFLLTIQLNDNDPLAAGAAVFELGLVPDFDLFRDPAQVKTRTGMNIRQARVLGNTERPERQRVIELGLTDTAFRARLADFLARTGLEDPRAWTRQIVVDKANWNLAFHRWPLREERITEALRITIGELQLPKAGDSADHTGHHVLKNITGQPFLHGGRHGLTQLAITFQVEPDPRRVAGLAKFVVHLLSEDSGPTGVTATVRLGKTAKNTYKATLKKLRAAELEQGWHFIRVTPQDDEGVPLPVRTAWGDGADDSGPGNESDRFMVIADDDFDEPPPRQRVVREVGVSQALRRLEFKALEDSREWRGLRAKSVSWKSGEGAGRYVLHATFGGHGSADIPLAPTLLDVQRRVLAEPGRLRRWRIPVKVDHAGDAFPEDLRIHDGTDAAVDAFITARQAVLTAVAGDDGLVVEGRELLDLRSEIQRYAEAYGELVSWQLRRAERAAEDRQSGLLRELAALLQIDTVEVGFTNQDGDRQDVVLVGPTHPLRLLWLVTWSELGHRWLENARENTAPVIAAAGRTLEDLTPLGFPLAVPLPDGSLTIAAGDLNPYWGVCLPTGAVDPQGLLSMLSSALRLPGGWTAGQAVSGRVLADRVERYLRLHPYVRTLVISAVNAGRADHLAEMLLELQRRKDLADVSYDIRLFAPDAQAAGNGEALAELLRGEGESAAGAEVFHTRTSTGIVPKLAVAVRPLPEFRAATSEHPAHITMLFDALSGESFNAAPRGDLRMAPVHGLVQDVSTMYVEDEEAVTWHKQPQHGPAQPITGAEEFSDLLSALPATLSSAAAAVATGQVGTDMVPRVTLNLDAHDGALLHQAHRSSDWVITVDRTMGLEYFDSPGSERRPDYVIDFDVEGAEGLGHHLVVSSRSVGELRALLAPACAQHGFSVDARHTGTFFDQLRLLSGRLAFKLASATPTERTEVLGLALARLFLDYQGVLADQILVPLDAHLGLYRESRKRADEVAEAVSLKRTDLALLSLDARRRTITCRLVEVKCYSTLSGLAAYEQLKSRMIEQLDGSQTVLAEHFDPHRENPDRPDRAVRNAELGAMLRFYVGRAVRHRTMRPDAAAEARWLLDRLDAGYRLDFTRTGLIFDLSGRGTSSEFEAGVEFHRIGRNLAEELLDSVPKDPVLPTTETTLSGLDLTMPRLSDAAFRAPARDHATPEEPIRIDSVDLAEEAVPESGSPEPGVAGSEPIAAEADPPPSAEIEPVPGPVPVGLEDAPAGQGEIPDVFLGTSGPSPQYGVLGEAAGRRIALDLNETHTISLFGVQGGGKSYTLGSIIEAASLSAPPVNRLPSPLATIVFHYSPTLDYAPEFTSMLAANDDPEQTRILGDTYGGRPAALTDVVMLVPGDQLDQRRAEHPGIRVLPLKFGSAELRAEHWRFLMGAIGNQSTYIRQLQRIMKAHRRDLRLDLIRAGVEQSSLSDNLKQLAQQRLDLAADYIDDGARVKPLVRPGRMIIVDLRDEYIEKDEALGLFVVLMQLFAEAGGDSERFNKLVVFDEAHKYIESPDLVAGLVESVREMRHKGMSVLVASQDPPSVPISLIELSNHIILHKFTSPAWLKHLQKANASLADLTPARMANLGPGEAYVWSSKASDVAFTRSAGKMRLRPRVTKHGGDTKTAT